MNWSVYLLKCSDGTLYCGITKDPDTRLARHNSGQASHYTRSRLPVKFICLVAGFTRSQALKLEYHIKQQPRNMKIKTLLKYERKQ